MGAREIVGSIMIALLWAICMTTAILLIKFWPVAQTGDDATGTVVVFLAVAGIGTWFLIKVYF